MLSDLTFLGPSLNNVGNFSKFLKPHPSTHPPVGSSFCTISWQFLPIFDPYLLHNCRRHLRTTPYSSTITHIAQGYVFMCCILSIFSHTLKFLISVVHFYNFLGIFPAYLPYNHGLIRNSTFIYLQQKNPAYFNHLEPFNS